MSTRSFLIPQPLAEYVDRTWIDEPEVLRELRAETAATMDDPEMQISADLGQFLTVILRANNAKSTLEIGVFTGYSSTVTALALPRDGKVIACDVSEEFTSVARKYWEKAGVSDKIDLRIGPATESLSKMLLEEGGGTFDFAFIDADKGNYWSYFDACVRLVRPGGLIAVDNVLWSGRVADPDVTDDRTNSIREFNRRVHEDTRVVASLVPVGDGLTLAVKL